MENLFQEYWESRPQRLCKRCGKCNDNPPLSPFDKLPEECGYEGWMFQQREVVKQQIRKQKELLMSLEIKLKRASCQEALKLSQRINKIKKLIDSYAKYGSKNW